MTDTITQSELLARLDDGWNDLQAFVTSLSKTQLTTLTDAGGWTVKDHLIHLAVWEDSVDALLQKQSRCERMGVDDETWSTGDWDRVNAIIYKYHRDMSLADVLKTFADVHQRLVERLRSLSAEDLLRPYCEYQPGTTYDRPVMGAVIAASYAHYAEHRPWMERIANPG